MEYIPLAFIAGILTVLAPCVFPMLPVILGGSLGAKNYKRPIIVILSLVISIITFTLLLKFFVIGIPEKALKAFSSIIIILFGLSLIFPHQWDKLANKFSLGNKSQKLLNNSSKKSGTLGYIALGASLGPVFSACSPTYFLIVGTILPQSFFIGFINLLVYAFGLFLVLMIVAIFGQKITKNAQWATNSNGIFKKIFGLIFVLMGIAIYLGYDKVLEAQLLNTDLFYYLSTIESRIID